MPLLLLLLAARVDALLQRDELLLVLARAPCDVRGRAHLLERLEGVAALGRLQALLLEHFLELFQRPVEDGDGDLVARAADGAGEEEKQKKIEEEKLIALKHKEEEEERIKEENRRIKEWEDKFDQEQRIREEELIKKFYSDHSKPSKIENGSNDNMEKEEKN